jgi:hypothetical protein
MTRSKAVVGFAGLAAGMALLWAWSGPLSQRGVGHEGPDEKKAAISVPSNPVELRITLGIDDEEQIPWDGKLTVTGGKLLSLDIVDAARNATVDGTSFAVRSRRVPPGNKPKAKAKAKAKKNADDEFDLTPAVLRAILDAPGTAMVEVTTKQGNFAFALADVKPGTAKKFLEGQASISREEAATKLTGRDTDDDYPVMAKAKDGTVWLAYVEYTSGPTVAPERIASAGFGVLEPKGNGDRIRLMRFDGQTWSAPIDVTDGGRDVWRPAIAIDGQGAIVIAWAEKLDNDWSIYSRRYTPAAGDAKGSWSAIAPVVNAPGSDFGVVAATDSSGKVWLAWQAFRGDNYEILASSSAAGAWGAPTIVSQSKANDWSPAIAADDKGGVYVAWDTYDQKNYDVKLAKLDAQGQPSQTWTVAGSSKLEARPHLACDAAGRVWIGYDEGDEQWGKDYASDNEYKKVGLEKNPGYALYVNRTVRVKCLVDSTLKEAVGDLEAAFGKKLQRNKTLPRMAVDSAGGIWMIFRHHPLAGGGGEVWNGFATRYNGKEWSPAENLASSSCLMDVRPALIPVGTNILTVYPGDNRTKTQDRDQHDLYSTILRPSSDTVEPQLAPDKPAPAAQVDTVHPNEAEDIARLRAHRVTYGGKELRLLRGEFHRHTEYTAHRDQDGLIEDSLRYAHDAGDLDWMGNGDHDNGLGYEYMWWQIQKFFDLHTNTPSFLGAMTYERSVVYPNGHRNVIMPRRGIRPLPRGDIKSGSAETGTPDTKELYAYLKHFGGMCSSHTSGTNMGTDWRDNDPEVEPVVEIYQGHRHNYEHFGAPRSATAQTQIGGYQPAGFIWNALEKGYRLGFQSSSDHVSTHISYGIALAEENSRPAIIEAFKKRHSYAATDNILLVVRSGDHLMGDIFETRERPTISIEAVGTAPIAKLSIVRDNKYIYAAEPNTKEVQQSFTDMDATAGKTSYYYVRIEQADGNLAWASPMWITWKN